jgi:hypothetical protein
VTNRTSNYYRFTHFPTRNAIRSGETTTGTLLEMHPPHYVASRKDSVPCVGDYVLNPGSRRANDAVREKTMLTLDVDTEVQSLGEFAAAELRLDAASTLLEAAGIEHLVYSSYSHGRPKDGDLPYFGFRLVVPFAEPMTRDNTPNLAIDFKAAAKAAVAAYQLPGNIMALSQPWYVPSVPDAQSLAGAVYHHVPGVPLDWRTLVFKRGAPYVQAPVVEVEDAEPKSVSVEEVRGRLGRIHDGKTSVALRYVLAGTAPAPGEVRSRHEDLLIPVTLAIARTSEPGEQVDDLLAVLEPWLDTMQNVYPRSGAGWLGEARRALSGALAKLPQWRAQHDAENEAFIKTYEERRARAQALAKEEK